MAKSTDNILNALRPLCLYNAILGLTVIEIPFGRPWPKLSVLFVLLRSAIYCWFCWNNITNIHSDYFNFEAMLTTIRFIVYSNIFIAVAATYLGLKNYNKVKRFGRKITLADETLEIFGIDPEYEVTRRECTRAICIWCLCSFVILGSDIAIAYYLFSNYYDAIVKTLVFEIPLILNLTIDLNFSILVSTLGKRFERLNALVQSVACTTPQQQTDSLRNRNNKYENILKKCVNKVATQSNNNYNKNRSNIELVLRTARQLHLDLCATSRAVNDTFSKQLSMQMAASFLLLTGFSYCVYIVYKDVASSLSKKLQITSFGIWIAMSVFRIIYVVRVSVNASNESQKTSQIAHEIQVSRWQKQIIDEIHQLSLQIMQHPLYFTASGLIVLDFSYVRGFVGSVTTYLMILIQNQPDILKAANTLAETGSDNITSNNVS